MFQPALHLYPGNGAIGIDPDVQLRLTLAVPPAIGTRARIRVFDATDDRLVDELDLSVPPGPTVRSST